MPQRASHAHSSVFFFHSAVQKLLIYLTSTYFLCFELSASPVQITVTLHSWSKNSEPLRKDFRSFTLFFREAHGCAQERNKEVSRISANTFNEERWEIEGHFIYFSVCSLQMSVQTLPSRFTHGKFRPSVTIKTFPKLVKKKLEEIYEAGKLPQRSDSPASQEPRTADMNGMESTMQEKKSKTKNFKWDSFHSFSIQGASSGEHCCLMLPADFESARIVTLDAGKLFGGGGERMTHRVFGAWQALSHCLVSAYRSDFEKFRCHREQVTAAWLAREKKLGNTLVGLM